MVKKQDKIFFLISETPTNRETHIIHVFENSYLSDWPPFILEYKVKLIY